MVDVSEKMIEAGCKEIFRLGMNATEAIAPVELCRAIYTAMHSAREVDGETIGQIKHDLIAARDRLNRAIEELIDSEVAAIAAMGEGDDR